ncbi:hypothetical protein Tco_1130843 [Tanacetum coccineum]
MEAGDSNDALVCCFENTVEDRIMDFGASFHATNCKEELERFKLRSGLKRRLILVGQLDEEGYHIGFEDQQWKVTKGSLVVAHENKHGSLYMVEDWWFGEEEESFLHNVSEDKETVKVEARLGIPEEWRGKDTSLAHLKVFGCDSLVKVKDVCGEAMKYSIYEAKSVTNSCSLTKPIQKSQVVLVDILENLAENDSIVAEHGLSLEITQSPDGSSNTSEGSENSRSFEDIRRSDKEDSED